MAKLECFEHNASKLQPELQIKSHELDERRKLQKQLFSKDWFNYFQKYKEQLEESEKEKKLLADKIISLERKINDLQKNHVGRISGA